MSNVPISSDEREEALITLVFAIRDLTSELARFRRFQEQADAVSLPAIRYADTMRPPSHGPPGRSWHENLRHKRVSLPAAGTVGILGAIAIELGRALLDGRLRFW